MQTFQNVKFRGAFRSYQQNVLDNMKRHMSDKKIHIVAAPGSGKTILGLELIRRMNAPALVFSPSVTIRQQWGERFRDKFMPEGESEENYVSYDLKAPSLITSVTYQALHAAYNKIAIDEKPDDDEDKEAEANEDFSGFDLIKTIREIGIKTICLDEAHHLRSEWQKALEEFIEKLGSSVSVISLTATPPYDSTPGEWKRYSSLCGEIDDEIFVPQLVGQKTLCPHQDYIVFSYPTQTEETAIKQYNETARTCTEQILNGGLYDRLLTSSRLLTDYGSMEEIILDNENGVRDFLSIAASKGTALPKDLLFLISCGKEFPPFSIKTAESAFSFVLDKPEIFGEELCEELRKTLSSEGLIEKRKVALTSSEKLDKLLISSMGKLESIKKIASAEINSLGDKLRMLVLTDYIKKDLLKIIGTDETITSIGTVPVFEAIRRSVSRETKIGVLSGGLVIVPDSITEQIKTIAEGVCSVNAKPLGETGYSEIAFGGSNKNKVAVITEAFQKGMLNILVGTKSLLGEGWDSPCINSLILASFVGSFMLSNQMRGRAIRTDSSDSGKTSNIWHLTTIMPEEAKREPDGADWETLKRRFECFVAPSYSKNSIESGISRADIIQPPFSKENIDVINGKMLTLAADRKAMADKWTASAIYSKKSSVADEIEIEKKAVVRVYAIAGLMKSILWLLLFFAAVAVHMAIISPMKNAALSVLSVAAIIAILTTLICKVTVFMRLASSKTALKRLMKAVFVTLKEMGVIESRNAEVDIVPRSDGVNEYIGCSLSGVTAHESSVFSTAVSELLSPIDNPRYLLICRKKSRLDYRISYACPSVIGVNKENAEKLAANMKKTGTKFAAVFTRSQDGKRELLNCRKNSCINKNDKPIGKKRITKFR